MGALLHIPPGHVLTLNETIHSEHIEPKFVHLFVQAMIVKVLRPEVFAGAVPRLAPASDLGPASDVQVGPARTPSPRKSPRKSPQKSPGKARWGRHQILQLCYFKQYLGLSYPNIGVRTLQGTSSSPDGDG